MGSSPCCYTVSIHLEFTSGASFVLIHVPPMPSAVLHADFRCIIDLLS